MKKLVLLVCLLVVALFACRKDDPVVPDALVVPPTQPSPVDFDPQNAPYDSLSKYGFFTGDMTEQVPVQGVIPFAPITPLFSDYAHKFRFVWMPDTVRATYNSDGTVLEFPDGAVLIKTFYYDRVLPADARRLVETRLMFKKNGAWQFANYVWNADQTEAIFDLSGSYKDISWMDGNDQVHDVNYRIPSEAECFTCHKKNNAPAPIGVKPRNMNNTYPYADGAMNQLQKWEAMGYLDPNHAPVGTTVARWDDPSADLQDRVRAYLDMNCSQCHSDGGHCDYRPMRFLWEETVDPVNLGVCVEPQDPIAPGITHIVAAGNAARSMVHYRLATNAVDERMPLLGRSVIHEEGLQLITDWIDSLDPPCP